jgi:hypothetical protein
MKIAYFPKQTALNSESIWQGFLEGCIRLGLTPIENSLDADAAVIWSALWHGRMEKNLEVFNHYRNKNLPVFIIEVGSLDRGRTWKVSANNIDNTGIYGLDQELFANRENVLDIHLSNTDIKRRPEILIAGQHDRSLQWTSDLPMVKRISETIDQIRKYTQRPIVVRPHPRNKFLNPSTHNVTYDLPVKLPDTYDKYNLDYNYHCVINYSSSPAVLSSIAGTPVICDSNSLAYPMSSIIENIENCKLPNREAWFLNIIHTEWTVDEIKLGVPQLRILNSFNC